MPFMILVQMASRSNANEMALRRSVPSLPEKCAKSIGMPNARRRGPDSLYPVSLLSDMRFLNAVAGTSPATSRFPACTSAYSDFGSVYTL